MSDKTYNGWTNYATWRVCLEMFDGQTSEDIFGRTEPDAYLLGKMLQECAEQIIEDTSTEGLARDYAYAFLQEVNWYEIAEHMVTDETEAA